MHKIGDNLIYGSNGVMSVVDIREEQIGDLARSYYVLRAANGRSESLVFVPTDNERLTSLMHPILTRSEADSLLSSPIDTAQIEWSDNSRARTEYFKRIIESGDRSKIFAMIRAIYESGLRREESGKKNYLSDETVSQRAQKLISTELSLVLGISEEESAQLVEAKIKA